MSWCRVRLKAIMPAFAFVITHRVRSSLIFSHPSNTFMGSSNTPTNTHWCIYLHGPPVTTKPSGYAVGVCGDRRPSCHVFHTSRQAMIETYNTYTYIVICLYILRLSSVCRLYVLNACIDVMNRQYSYCRCWICPLDIGTVSYLAKVSCCHSPFSFQVCLALSPTEICGRVVTLWMTQSSYALQWTSKGFLFIDGYP